MSAQMSPEKMADVMHNQVYLSALEIKLIGFVNPVSRKHHESRIRKICAALFGPEWSNYTSDEQQAKKRLVEEEYERMLTAFLPVFQQFCRDSDELLTPDEATIAKLCGKTIDTSDKPADKKALTSDTPGKPTGKKALSGEVSDSRDQVARKRLGQKYWTYEQNRPDLVQMREEAPDVRCGPIDPNTIILSKDGKTTKCPQCAKKMNVANIHRHYREQHVLDPRHAIFCPRCPPGKNFYVDWRGDTNIDSHLWNHHMAVLNQTGKVAEHLAKAKGKAIGRLVARADTSKIDELEAEQADRVEGKDGPEAMDEEELDDDKTPDDETIDEEMTN